MEEEEKKEKPKCDKCGSEMIGNEMHTCPYKRDIDGDYETECNCCDDCIENCLGDI